MKPRLGFVKQARRIEQCVLVRGLSFDESSPWKRPRRATVRGAGPSTEMGLFELVPPDDGYTEAMVTAVIDDGTGS